MRVRPRNCSHSGSRLSSTISDPVLGVVDDVGEVVVVQAQVQRVEHGADRRNREIRLEVLLARPSQRRDAVARPDAERCERDREAAGPVEHVRVGVPHD